MADWVLPADAVPLFRLGYLFLCFVATWLGISWLRPLLAAVRAAVVAGGMQFCLGVLLDSAGVWLGLWRYVVTDGLLLAVPIDLHLAWSLLFGVLFAVASPQPRAAAVRYGVLWWLATVTVDALGAARLDTLLTRRPGLGWLAGDLLLVGVLLLITLWLYRSVLVANLALPSAQKGPVASDSSAPPRGATLRAALYLVTFGALTFLCVPQQILLYGGHGLWPLPTWPLVARGGFLAAIGIPLMWAAWAVREFTAAAGTPLPYDPPHRLVCTGPYAFVRNPMQLGVVLAMAGISGYYRSWALLLYALELVLLSEALFERYEVPELSARFGADFVHYHKNVRRWLPQLHPYVPRQPSELVIVYDDRCTACVSSVAFLQQLSPAPLQLEPLPIGAQAVRLRIYERQGNPQERRLIAEYEGLDACLQILRRCPLYLAWLVPFGELWPLRPLLKLCYRAIAETRR